MSDVERMVVKIHLAAKGMHINSSHVGYETYYVRVATGSIQPVTTKAFYVPGLEQDLLGGRALIRAKFLIILDNDPRISGIFTCVRRSCTAPSGVRLPRIQNPWLLRKVFSNLFAATRNSQSLPPFLFDS